MHSQNGVTGLLRTGILVLLLASCISVAGASAKVSHSCGTLYIGQMDVDVSGCVSGDTVGWWASPPERYTTTPSGSIVIGDKSSFDVDTVNTGIWYNLDSSGTPTTIAFRIMEPRVQSCGIVYKGDTIDVTNCVSGNTIGWWAGPAVDGAPSAIVGIKNKQFFFVDPATFTGYYGNWYNYNSRTGETGPLAFFVGLD